MCIIKLFLKLHRIKDRNIRAIEMTNHQTKQQGEEAKYLGEYNHLTFPSKFLPLCASKSFAKVQRHVQIKFDYLKETDVLGLIDNFFKLFI